MSSTPTIESLIARRVSRGFNLIESGELLSELVARHSGDNLAHALVYQGFATDAQAHAFVTSSKQ